ncbi:MAG: HD domain-containing protein [Ruminococcus sp.]|nr:HD domain-containing protein [Ruminococcus sp.]
MREFLKGISSKLRALLCVAASSAVMLTMSGFSSFADDSAPDELSETEISVDPTGKGDGYSAYLYDNTNGLPTAEANAVAQTEEGFIWIGSYSGLIRYDGSQFVRIDSNYVLSSVVSLYVDSRNRLWIGTNDSGLAVMENGEYRHYGKAEGLKALSVRSVTEAPDGSIYVATTRGIAVIGTDMQMKTMDEPQINNEYIRMLKTGADGVIYGITIEGDIFTVKDGRLTNFFNAKKTGIVDIHSILPDPDNPGWVYIGNKESGLYHGNIAEGLTVLEEQSVAPLYYVNSIERIGDMTWVCTDNGIGFFSGGEFTHIENIPMTTSVEDIMVDYQGNLWFVSSQQGVMKIVPNQFTDIFDKYYISDEVVYSTCISEGKLFIGTKNSGLKVISANGTLAQINVTEDKTASGSDCGGTDLIKILSGSKIRSIIRDSKDRLWFSTFGTAALVRYDHGKVLRFTTADGLPSERVRTVHECSDGSFIVACTGGVAHITGDRVTEVYGESSGITNTEILTVCEGVNGEIIIGTDGDGIYVIKNGNTLHFGTDDGLCSDVVMRVKRDRSRDIFWIVTSNSIAYMDSSFNITTIQNFPYSNNFDLYENSSGQMWVLSSNGIYVADVEQLIANDEITTIYYGRDDGLPCIATSNSYSEYTAAGDLYISGTTGIAKVNIDNSIEDIADLKIAVPFIEADGDKLYPDEAGNFRISSDVKKVTIYGYVYNYSLINPQVTYWLEGFDDNGTSVKRSELDPINYTNLKGGSYKFVMKVSDDQGRSSKTLTIKIIKEKSLYEKTWFRVLSIVGILLLIGLAVFFYIRMRIKKFRKKEQEQKMLTREIVEAFAKVIDMKDKYTNGHSTRVAEYTCMLARELGCDEETVDKYHNIALLHDIGKVGVPPEVLNKPGKLTDTEFNIIKSHSALGYNTLKDISIMPELAVGAGAHHERPDGKGYPKGLKSDEIPRVAQIIAVADTFDAMYSDRPYRKRMNFDKAVSIMKEVRGTQLAEDVVDAFLRLVDKGEFRAPDDEGGGTTEDIDNIHKKQKSGADADSTDAKPADSGGKKSAGSDSAK